MTSPVPLTPIVTTPTPENGIMVRVALLEAKMRIVVLFLEGLIVAFITALIAYFFKGG
jgi:hypothetical protein